MHGSKTEIKKFRTNFFHVTVVYVPERKFYVNKLHQAEWKVGALECPGASTVISQPLDSKTLPWLAIPAAQP